jgi:hypothetical protein
MDSLGINKDFILRYSEIIKSHINYTKELVI